MADIIDTITGHTPLTEQVVITNPPNTNNSPDEHPDEDTTQLNISDVTFFTADATIHLDVMVTSATTVATLAGNTSATVVPGEANCIAELYKRKRYHPHPITPIVFEAHGRFGGSVLTFLQQLTATLPTPREQTAMYHYCIQRLSTCLQRNNAQTIITHLKTAPTATAPTLPAAPPPAATNMIA